MWLFFYLYVLLAIIAAFFEVWLWPLGRPNNQAPAGKAMVVWHRAVVSFAQNTPLLGASSTDVIATPAIYGGLSDSRLVNFMCGSPVPAPNCGRNLALGIPDELNRKWNSAVYRYNPGDPTDARRVVATWVAPPPASSSVSDGAIYLWGLTQAELSGQLQKAGGLLSSVGIVEAATSANCVRACLPGENTSACLPAAIRGTRNCLRVRFMTPTNYTVGSGTYIIYPLPPGAAAAPAGSVAIVSFGG